jgi:dolichol-phosphate mannosyltransferase
MSSKKTAIAIIIPTFNEAETIFRLVTTLLAAPFVQRIVIVDDSLDDRTITPLKSLQNNPRLTIIHRQKKGGRGSAVMDGMRALASDNTIDYVIEMDADFSHQPQEIPALVDKIIATKAGLVVASRYLPGSRILNWPIKRRLFSKLSNQMARWVLKIPLSDYTNGFRIYPHAVTQQLTQTPLLGPGFIALSDVLVRIFYNGWRVEEIPSHFHNRTRGESALCFKEITQALLGLFKIRSLAKKLKKQQASHTID